MAENADTIRGLSSLLTGVMNAAAPGGTPPRRIGPVYFFVSERLPACMAYADGGVIGGDGFVFIWVVIMGLSIIVRAVLSVFGIFP
jgi:hypothetical protein